MTLGLAKNQVALVPYNYQWQREFQETKANLIANTNLSPKHIEHIGSTAIPGLSAKPILDLLIGVDKLSALDDRFFAQLKQCGFYRLQITKTDEIICAKFADPNFQIKTHIIHLVTLNQGKWHDLIFFRDFLTQQSAYRHEYAGVKQAFFDTELKGIAAYTFYKESFVKKVLAFRQT